MIEAIGHRQYGEFFRRAPSCSRRDGRMVLQSITIADRHYARARDEVDFIKRYIFPGCLHSVGGSACGGDGRESATCGSCTSRTSGRTTRPRSRAGARTSSPTWRTVRALGYPDTFVRMWEFYLCYCEAGFAERPLGDVQMLIRR